MMKEKNLLLVGIFAIAMAYLESAVVVYLRVMYGIEDLIRDVKFTPDIYTLIEIGREAATIVMLAFIGLIAGNTKLKKLGYFFYSFGAWDIFYYIWLFIFIQWPKSLFEWDILFLIPLPWWGPVIAPVLISILLITIGYLLIKEVRFKIKIIDWVIFSLSVIIILYTFMEDSIRIAVIGDGDINEIRPISFNWILFLVAFAGMLMNSFKVFFLSEKKSS